MLCSFLKVIRCGGSDDGVTLRCQDNSDSISIVIENAGTYMCSVNIEGVWITCYSRTDQDKTASFELKLMEVDAEHLSLPVSAIVCVLVKVCIDHVCCHRKLCTVLWCKCLLMNFSVLCEICPSSMTLSLSRVVRKGSSSPLLLTQPLQVRPRSSCDLIPPQTPKSQNRYRAKLK